MSNPDGPLGFVVRQVATGDLLDLQAAQSFTRTTHDEPTFYWQHPARGEAWLAAGSVREFVASGPDRIDVVAAAIRRCLRALQPADGRPPAALPCVVGGFAFSGEPVDRGPWREFPAARFFLPRRLWIQRAGRCDLVEVLGEAAPALDLVQRDDIAPWPVDETPGAWLERVASALGRIERGEIDKVVLSRQHHFPGLSPPPLRVLRTLRDTRPGCATFAFKPGTSVFFGSTPELMVRRNGERFVAPALAGTMRRGGDPHADLERARALARCAKNRREHDAVVDGIRAALAGCDVVLDAAREPRVIALPEAFHLRTRISGRSATRLDVLALAAALHPTPAVCGTPRAAAARLLRSDESGRGWYTGGIGWMDARGDGEIAVALRSALLAGHGLTTFAGAGIVRGSEPLAELAETELKMAAILAPLRDAAAAATRRDDRGGEALRA